MNRNIFSGGRALFSVPFIASLVILAAAAAGLKPAMHALAKEYRKETIPIRKPLADFDMSRLPGFARDWTFKHQKTVDDIETDEYAIIRLKCMDGGPGPSRAIFFVTYYSKQGDKVPHTPDVCYRQAGAVIKKMTTVMIDTPSLGPEYKQIPVNLLLFEMPNGTNQAVIFFFCVEGQFRQTREQVRWLLNKPGNRFMYFSKIEASTNYPLNSNPTPAIELCKKILSEATVILATEYYPSRAQIKRR